MRLFVFVSLLVCLCMAEMNIVYLKEAAAKTGAVCLDGTPAAYYFKPGSAANSTKWILYLEGGGFCVEPENCAVRAKTKLGSSAEMEPTFDFGGMLYEDPRGNPEFYDWNHVLFAYCDGAAFAGDVEDPVEVDGKLIYFRGLRNLKAIMNDLLENKGMNRATEVILSGGSAGGIGVFLHADRIGEMLPGTVARYKAIPQSGVFLDRPNAEGKIVLNKMFQRVFQVQNCGGGVNTRCVVSKSPRYMHLCMFAEYSMQFISTPLFILNSNFDSFSTNCIIGAEPTTTPLADLNCSAVPGWLECEMNNSKCTDEEWDAIEAYADDFTQRVKTNEAMSRDGNGLFEFSCHTHVAEGYLNFWTSLTVQNTTACDAVSKWYYSHKEPASQHTYKDCDNHRSYCCNPTCCPSSN